MSCKSKQVLHKPCSLSSQYSVQFLGVKHSTRISLKTRTNIKAARQQNIHLNLALNQSKRCKPGALALQWGSVTHISSLSSVPVRPSFCSIAPGDTSLVVLIKLSKCTGQLPPSHAQHPSPLQRGKFFLARKVVFRKNAAIKTLYPFYQTFRELIFSLQAALS